MAIRLAQTFLEDRVAFVVEGWDSGQVPPLPLSSWPPECLRELTPPETWQAIGELWAEGVLSEPRPGRYEIPYEKFPEVPGELAGALGLTPDPDVRISVTSRSHAGSQEFRLVAEIMHSEIGRLEGAFPRFGPVIVLREDRAVVLSRFARVLLDTVERMAGSGANSLEEQLAAIGQVRELAAEAGASLDSYLANEDVRLVGELGVSLGEKSDGSIEIHPVIPGAGVGTNERLQRVGASTPFHSEQRGRNRRRFVLGDKAKTAAHELQGGRVLRENEVPEFLVNPEAFVPEEIDLKQYSDRVKSISVQVYNSRPYVHVRRTAGGWFEGALEVETENLRTEGSAGSRTSKAPSLSPETMAKMAKMRLDQDSDWVSHDGEWHSISRQDAEALGRMEKVAPNLLAGPCRLDQGVLEIFTNVELLEYVRGDDVGLNAVREELATPPVPLPACFQVDLHPFQHHGFSWMAQLADRKSGGLLADEMGLGKTVQVIALLARMQEQGALNPTIVVVPRSLLENWEREIRRFMNPPPTILRHDGPKRERMARLRCAPDVLLISYDTLRRDQLELARIDWKLVVCDEAQYVKNPTAQRTSVVKALKQEQRLALTGTPVENGLIELWCILDFVQPGGFGSWSEFRDEFERPIAQAESANRTELVSRLQERLGSHYLRRLKQDVLSDLPPRRVQRVEVPLSPGQLHIYREIVREIKGKGRGVALGALTRLLQVCAQPPSGNWEQEIDDAIAECPKLAHTLEILDDIRLSGEKVIVFTRFLALQALIQSAVRHRFGLHPDCINGSVTSGRQQIIDLFSRRSGFNVLVMSHDAGGVGLNVTAANHVIHYTRPWNPAKENQASDRTHRIGQKLPVKVYLPVTTHPGFVTVEARLAELLAAKSQLARDVLVPSKEWEVSPEDLLSVLDEPLEAAGG